MTSLAVAVASASAACFLYCRVKAFDHQHECDVLSGAVPVLTNVVTVVETNTVTVVKTNAVKKVEAKVAATNAVTKVATTNAVTNAVAKVATTNVEAKVEKKVELSVRRVEYDGNASLDVVLSERPDMDVVRRYVRVEPMSGGAPGFSYEARYNYRREAYEPVLHVTGDFAYRTNVTLRILKGFPLYGKGANPTAAGSLARDFSYAFRRKDPAPYVKFADDGRYLPPGGRNAVRVESVSVTNIATAVCRVEPRNVVQLLARDEGVYSSRRWQPTVDEEDTAELAGECATGLVACANVPCRKETNLVRVGLPDGGSAKGVFLVTIRNADRPRNDWRWRNPKYNPNLYRLVCLSDIGLSVRESGGKIGVWATSLTTGRPMPSVHVEVYSSANVLLASGKTDVGGWSVPKRCANGKAFAVVAWTPDDMTFMALRDSMRVDETRPDGTRPKYLKDGETDAFVWTERGIYRHGEKVFVHVLARNGRQCAPKPMPLVLTLANPEGRAFATKTLLTDAEGALAYDGFSVPAEQPSGKWLVRVALPGKGGRLLAEREIKVEEFAPPQIRVRVTADETLHPSNFAFRISAEHLFGGPARGLACEGAVVFEDVPFAPATWKGWRFGNDELGLKPNFRRMSQRVLDGSGACTYDAALWADAGRPKAAVRVTGQGVVFEDGGRPATSRKSFVSHYYPFYVGSDLADWVKLPQAGQPRIRLVCVAPDGELVRTARKLVGRIERIDSVYSYRKRDDGTSTWDCERIRSTVFEQVEIAVDATGRAECALPLKECGDYVFTATDPETGASFGRAFYLSDWGDNVVRAPLSDPTEVSISADKPFYRLGDRPRLVVKSPFPGYALMYVLHDGVIYSEIMNLTNATSEVVLQPAALDWTPNVDIAISVVQSVEASARHLAARAHGLTTLRVRPAEREIEVKVGAKVEERKTGGENRGTAVSDSGAGDGGCRVVVDLEARGATAAVVTLVDEGINLLTGEETPNPVRRLSRDRAVDLPLYDLYGRILPVADDGLKANGVKTGGGFGAEMLGRVSPVPTRRFRPLAQWKARVDVKDGRGRAVFDLPEFVGEVRVTAVAYSASAAGAASVRTKVSPKLVMQPDAPRFVAPGDAFDVTLPLRNASGQDGEVAYEISCPASGQSVDAASSPRHVESGRVFLRRGGDAASTNVTVRLTAPMRPGEMSVRFVSRGFGERHVATLSVPVRPAVAWKRRTEVVRLDPGEVLRRTVSGDCAGLAVTVGDSPMAELAGALEWLADYPHGCLEQTTSRIFPLVAAGGILNSVASKAETNREEYVAAGVARVASMIRENDFVAWPDCTCPPWDREVSLYAAHFLVEAERAGRKLAPAAKAKVLKFLKGWALSTNVCVSAYACHTLALAGTPERDRMFRLYDGREGMDALSRSRLARAFAAIRDAKRAEALMAYAVEPQSVRECAFRILALLDLNPDDPRLPALVAYLTAHRDRERFAWGTTSENAHALLAIGAYYMRHPAKGGEVKVGGLGKRDRAVFDAGTVALTNTGPATAFLSVCERWLPEAASVTNESNGIFVSRRFLTAEGLPANTGDLVRGEMLIAELTVTSDVTRVVGDLVIEDLFAGAFEPVHRELDPSVAAAPLAQLQTRDWVLRKDARDDRMLVYSKRFVLERGRTARVLYPVRVVSAGDFTLPGPSVEAMYSPELRARRAAARLVVRRVPTSGFSHSVK